MVVQVITWLMKHTNVIWCKIVLVVIEKSEWTVSLAILVVKIVVRSTASSFFICWYFMVNFSYACATKLLFLHLEVSRTLCVVMFSRIHDVCRPHISTLCNLWNGFDTSVSTFGIKSPVWNFLSWWTLKIGVLKF